MEKKDYWSPLKFARMLTRSSLQSIGKNKVFCIGRNKTGTTSIMEAFHELGLIVGNQYIAERYLIESWAKRDFRKLFSYCRTAQAFQDVPFSLQYTFQAVDQKFPGSKFILTVRDSDEQWYNSMVIYYGARYGNGHKPSDTDLMSAEYIYSGYVYKREKLTYQSPPDDPYHKDTLIAQYNAHNSAVLDYFRHRPQDLLVINVSLPGAYDQLCDFLGKPRTGKELPWKNKTNKTLVSAQSPTSGDT